MRGARSRKRNHLKGTGPRIRASCDAHRRVVSSSLIANGKTPAEGGRGGPTSPGGRFLINCPPPAGFAIPRTIPLALIPNTVPTPDSIVVVACRSTCAAALARVSNAGETNAEGNFPAVLVEHLLGVGIAGRVAGGVLIATAIGQCTAFFATSSCKSCCSVSHLLRSSSSGFFAVRGWRR